MHVEPARGFRDVAVAHLVDALDVLPAHAIRRHRIVRQFRLLGAAGQQRGDDVVGIGGLRRDNRPRPSSPRSPRWRCCRSRSARWRAHRAACASAPTPRRGRCRRRAASRPPRRPAPALPICASPSETLSQEVTVKPRVSIARDRRSRNGLSSSTISSERSEVGQFGDGGQGRFSRGVAVRALQSIWRGSPAAKASQVGSARITVNPLVRQRFRGLEAAARPDDLHHGAVIGKGPVGEETLAPVRSSSVRAMKTPSPRPPRRDRLIGAAAPR